MHICYKYLKKDMSRRRHISTILKNIAIITLIYRSNNNVRSSNEESKTCEILKIEVNKNMIKIKRK